VDPCLSGPLGGDVQIAAQIANGAVDGVFFLVDPLDKHPHDPDIQAIQRVCNVRDVPLATNLATANLLISAEAV
jgi:methylglyoxal synthase